MNCINIQISAQGMPLADVAAEMLQRGITERTGIAPTTSPDTGGDIVLDLREGIGSEGFAIEGEAGGPVRIVGNDGRGLIYGVGKFLRDARLAEGEFAPGAWRGVSVPQKPVRGMYFATHFHNWYHVAPIADVVRYVEDLALWGCNALSVWFDLSIYTGIDDPDAQAIIARLHTILAAAQRVGISPALTMLANEGFKTTPEALRATKAVQNGYFAEPCGFYGVEVCPNEPGGMELILKNRAEVLDAFAEIDLAYIWIWPYDQGGCTCAKCAPWGTKGFLKTAEAVAQRVRSRFPKARIVLSTWYFDRFVQGEWDGLRTAFAARKPDWVDYLMIDHYGDFPKNPLEKGIPGNFPVLSFAEISMLGMFPWGGYGANPRPRHWQANKESNQHLLSGGFPYSEGIYEDINKVLQFQFGWDPARDAEEIVREYAGTYFGAEHADSFLEACRIMEQNSDIEVKEDDAGLHFTRRNPLTQADTCFELIEGIDKALPEAIRKGWRWRIFWLRAAIDAEMQRSEGKASAPLAGYFGELTEIYHAQNADGACQPPQLDGSGNKIDSSVQFG